MVDKWGDELPENYGKEIDIQTFALLFAEMEKSLRKLGTLAHIVRQMREINHTLESMRNNQASDFYAYLTMERIRRILESNDYQAELELWFDELRASSPMLSFSKELDYKEKRS